MMTLRMYADCLVRMARALRRSPWTLLLPMAYALAWLPAQALVAPLGILGGFVLVLIYDALLASFLYVVSELVRGSPVKLREMPQSIKPFFWPIMNVLFVLFIARLLLMPLLASTGSGGALVLALSAVLFVILNAVPEVIYQKGIYGGLATISGSIEFIQQHWIEWFIPNVLVGAVIYFGARLLWPLPFSALLVPLLVGALVHATMVFRGFLFEALDGTTARQRALRYRLGR